jgi:cell wall assembly regulator SMI1
MTARIDEAGKPLTNDDLTDFETSLRLTLPTQYRAFLLRHNGGLVGVQWEFAVARSGGVEPSRP